MPDFDLDSALVPTVPERYCLHKRPFDPTADGGIAAEGQPVIDVFVNDGGTVALIGSIYAALEAADGGGGEVWLAAYPDWQPADEEGEDWWNRDTWWHETVDAKEWAIRRIVDNYVMRAPPGAAQGCGIWAGDSADLEAVNV